jgi:hypothetical protein
MILKKIIDKRTKVITKNIKQEKWLDEINRQSMTGEFFIPSVDFDSWLKKQ